MNSASSQTFNRRSFLKASGLALGAAGLTVTNSAEAVEISGSTVKVGKSDLILFQGDSITDAGRSRDSDKMSASNNQAGLGKGYPWLAAVELLTERDADSLRILNRGISGNKVFQLADRWSADCLDLKPDILSILIGVNDFWHTMEPKLNYKGTVEIYERDYLALIERTKKALPKVKLIIGEPFVLRCGAVKDNWFPEFDKYRAAARRVADKNKAAFVPFQTMFDAAVKYAPPDYWAKDGVHPSDAGAAMMAHFWLKALRK